MIPEVFGAGLILAMVGGMVMAFSLNPVQSKAEKIAWYIGLALVAIPVLRLAVFFFTN